MSSPIIQKLIGLFTDFPTVGPRTAKRFVFYLLSLPKQSTDELVKTLIQLKEKIRICSFCQNYFEDDGFSLCSICRDKTRQRHLLCVVEKESDLESVEKTHKYKGLYFVLGGTVSRLRKEEMKKLKTKELEERIKNPKKFGLEAAGFKEIILAFNPTTEGESTILYLERLLKPLVTEKAIKISRLAIGLPIGAELEYADEETLSSALEGRK